MCLVPPHQVVLHTGTSKSLLESSLYIGDPDMIIDHWSSTLYLQHCTATRTFHGSALGHAHWPHLLPHCRIKVGSSPPQQHMLSSHRPELNTSAGCHWERALWRPCVNSLHDAVSLFASLHDGQLLAPGRCTTTGIRRSLLDLSLYKNYLERSKNTTVVLNTIYKEIE
jgi:hypothetical protein